MRLYSSSDGWLHPHGRGVALLECSIAIREAFMELSSALPAKQLHAVCKIGQPAVPTLPDTPDTGQDQRLPAALLFSTTAVSPARSLDSRDWSGGTGDLR